MTAGRIRVVYLAHAFQVGGAEEMVLNLVRHLPERFEPHVCCIHEAGPIGDELFSSAAMISALVAAGAADIASAASPATIGVAEEVPQKSL